MNCHLVYNFTSLRAAPARQAPAAAPEVRIAAFRPPPDHPESDIDSIGLLWKAPKAKSAGIIKGERPKLEPISRAQGELEALQKQPRARREVLSDAAKADCHQDRRRNRLDPHQRRCAEANVGTGEKTLRPYRQNCSKEWSAYATEQGLSVVFRLPESTQYHYLCRATWPISRLKSSQLDSSAGGGSGRSTQGWDSGPLQALENE